MADRFFHHVRIERLDDWLKCGWVVAIPNAPSHHNHYGVMVEWLCNCTMARPR